MTNQQDRITYESCPLCGAKEMTTIREAVCSRHPLYNDAISPTMTWRRCLSCSHIFTDGYFTEEASKAVFSKTKKDQSVGADIEKQRFVAARMVEKVLPYAQAGLWLDVGFGNASLLFAAEEYGFTPVGIYLLKDKVEALKKTGIEGHCLDISGFADPRKFHVISMADVLEHMPFPATALKAAHALLEDGGVLLVSMPNADSMLWKALDQSKANPYWGELEHFHNFGRTTLYRLLAGHGFKPVRYGVSQRYRACMEVVAIKLRE